MPSATLAGRGLSPGTERVLFTLVANRALADSSKLAAADWIRGDVHQDTDLLNLEVDLLFLDTTSTYFETEQADEDVPAISGKSSAPAPPRRKPPCPGSSSKSSAAGET